jgi:hypothetical protein
LHGGFIPQDLGEILRGHAELLLCTVVDVPLYDLVQYLPIDKAATISRQTNASII